MRETLDFALQCSTGSHPPGRVDRVLDLMGLRECAETIIGSQMIRGVSGGQKKRVSVAEVLMGAPRVLCLDEISSGLDSRTTLDIVSALKEWAIETDGTLVASLLQPAPEVFALFDNVVCLMDGQIVYHGPRDGILEYLAELGLPCPHDKVNIKREEGEGEGEQKEEGEEEREKKRKKKKINFARKHTTILKNPSSIRPLFFFFFFVL